MKGKNATRRGRKRKQSRREEKWCSPYYLEQTELEAVRPLLTHTEIRKDEEARITIVILGIFEVIERRHD